LSTVRTRTSRNSSRARYTRRNRSSSSSSTSRTSAKRPNSNSAVSPARKAAPNKKTEKANKDLESSWASLGARPQQNPAQAITKAWSAAPDADRGSKVRGTASSSARTLSSRESGDRADGPSGHASRSATTQQTTRLKTDSQPEARTQTASTVTRTRTERNGTAHEQVAPRERNGAAPSQQEVRESGREAQGVREAQGLNGAAREGVGSSPNGSSLSAESQQKVRDTAAALDRASRMAQSGALAHNPQLAGRLREAVGSLQNLGNAGSEAAVSNLAGSLDKALGGNVGGNLARAIESGDASAISQGLTDVNSRLNGSAGLSVQEGKGGLPGRDGTNGTSATDSVKPGSVNGSSGGEAARGAQDVGSSRPEAAERAEGRGADRPDGQVPAVDRADRAESELPRFAQWASERSEGAPGSEPARPGDEGQAPPQERGFRESPGTEAKDAPVPEVGRADTGVATEGPDPQEKPLGSESLPEDRDVEGSGQGADQERRKDEPGHELPTENGADQGHQETAPGWHPEDGPWDSFPEAKGPAEEGTGNGGDPVIRDWGDAPSDQIPTEDGPPGTMPEHPQEADYPDYPQDGPGDSFPEAKGPAEEGTGNGGDPVIRDWGEAPSDQIPTEDGPPGTMPEHPQEADYPDYPQEGLGDSFPEAKGPAEEGTGNGGDPVIRDWPEDAPGPDLTPVDGPPGIVPERPPEADYPHESQEGLGDSFPEAQGPAEEGAGNGGDPVIRDWPGDAPGDQIPTEDGPPGTQPDHPQDGSAEGAEVDTGSGPGGDSVPDVGNASVEAGDVGGSSEAGTSDAPGAEGGVSEGVSGAEGAAPEGVTGAEGGAAEGVSGAEGGASEGVSGTESGASESLSAPDAGGAPESPTVPDVGLQGPASEATAAATEENSSSTAAELAESSSASTAGAEEPNSILTEENSASTASESNSELIELSTPREDTAAEASSPSTADEPTETTSLGATAEVSSPDAPTAPGTSAEAVESPSSSAAGISSPEGLDSGESDVAAPTAELDAPLVDSNHPNPWSGESDPNRGGEESADTTPEPVPATEPVAAPSLSSGGGGAELAAAPVQVSDNVESRHSQVQENDSAPEALAEAAPPAPLPRASMVRSLPESTATQATLSPQQQEAAEAAAEGDELAPAPIGATADNRPAGMSSPAEEEAESKFSGRSQSIDASDAERPWRAVEQSHQAGSHSDQQGGSQQGRDGEERQEQTRREEACQIERARLTVTSEAKEHAVKLELKPKLDQIRPAQPRSQAPSRKSGGKTGSQAPEKSRSNSQAQPKQGEQAPEKTSERPKGAELRRQALGLQRERNWTGIQRSSGFDRAQARYEEFLNQRSSVQALGGGSGKSELGKDAEGTRKPHWVCVRCSTQVEGECCPQCKCKQPSDGVQL